MKSLIAAVLLVLSASILGTARAEAQSACDYYRIKKGDTLRKIAKRAYGNDNFRQIYRENRRKIGRNPNIISVGTVIRMPCPEWAKKAQEDAAQEQEQASAATSGAPVSFVTANGYLPYTDESLEDRGLFTALVERAMVRAAPEAAMEVVFVNDWASHLDVLLPRQAFDASFPWTQPNCDAGAELGADDRDACENYRFSEPFYEIVDGFFSRVGAGHDNVVNAAGLAGTTICRPEGYPTIHLEELGLSEPAITLVQPPSAYACFERLMDETVDIVSLDTRSGEGIMNDLGITFDVVENPYLFSIQPLQVAVHASNPRGEEIIETLNQGRRIMLESGEWASIVSHGLKQQSAALTN